MAALADFNDYKKRLSAPREIGWVSKAQASLTTGRAWDWWSKPNPTLGAYPTTPAVPARTLLGALEHEDAAAEELFVLGAHLAGLPGVHILCDRLSHQGGLDSTVITANVTTNLPTAALTRYTSGDGVLAGLSIYAAVGTTAGFVSCTYTNEAGTGGRVSPLFQLGATGVREAGRFIHVPLMSGDIGIRSIESYTLSASTLTAGNFGFVLYKPLVGFCIDKDSSFATYSLIDGGMVGGLPPILDNACLFWLSIVEYTTLNGLYGEVAFTAV
jgi:hypothetical protein